MTVAMCARARGDDGRRRGRRRARSSARSMRLGLDNFLTREGGGVVPDRDWWNGPRLTCFLSVFSCLAAWSKEDVL